MAKRKQCGADGVAEATPQPQRKAPPEVTPNASGKGKRKGKGQGKAKAKCGPAKAKPQPKAEGDAPKAGASPRPCMTLSPTGYLWGKVYFDKVTNSFRVYQVRGDCLDRKFKLGTDAVSKQLAWDSALDFIEAANNRAPMKKRAT